MLQHFTLSKIVRQSCLLGSRTRSVEPFLRSADTLRQFRRLL